MTSKQQELLESIKEFIAGDIKALSKDIKSLENSVTIKIEMVTEKVELVTDRLKSVEDKIEQKVATQEYVNNKIELLARDVAQNKVDLQEVVTRDQLNTKLSDIKIIKWVLSLITAATVVSFVERFLSIIGVK